MVFYFHEDDALSLGGVEKRNLESLGAAASLRAQEHILCVCQRSRGLILYIHRRTCMCAKRRVSAGLVLTVICAYINADGRFSLKSSPLFPLRINHVLRRRRSENTTIEK
jgi:hypothetical protein